MTGNFTALFLATLGFVGGHFLLSYPPLRGRLVAALGEKPFLGVYSVLMVAFLAWVIAAYRSAPLVFFWDLGLAGRLVPLIVMPFALILAVVGLTTRNVTAVGGDVAADSQLAPKGIATITRHPFLSGAALWALAHLLANGDAASIILFGGMALLSVGGMAAIDHKRALKLGATWDAFARSTSRLPFGAAWSGRTRIDWAGIGWARPIAAVVLYVLLVGGHRTFFGVSALPAG